MRIYSETNIVHCLKSPPPWNFYEECKWCFWDKDVSRFRPWYYKYLGAMFLFPPLFRGWIGFYWWKVNKFYNWHIKTKLTKEYLKHLLKNANLRV